MNKPKNTMKVSFPSRGANEGLARMLVAAFITEADPTVEELCDIKTAVSEAVTNCIVHAYREKIDKVYITASIYPDSRIVIKIKDNGCGISSSDLSRVFEKGFTGYNGRADKKSTGIGLYLCKKIMDKMGHKIWIDSEVGKGTRVYLELTRQEWNPE